MRFGPVPAHCLLARPAARGLPVRTVARGSEAARGEGARRDPGDQSEVPASPWSLLLLGPRVPSTTFLRGNPGAGASAVPSQGPGQVASPRGQFVPRPSAIESKRNCVRCARAGSKKTRNMSEFWLISAPRDKENLQALKRMNTVTSKSNLSYNTKFTIPDFKVGTLDSLVGLSDELAKLDIFAESLIRRMAQSVVEVMEDAKGKVQENLLANGVDLMSFVTHFEWDVAKYPAKQPLVSMVDILARQLAQIDLCLPDRPEVPNSCLQHSEDKPRESGEEIHGKPFHSDPERHCEQRRLRARF